MKPWTVLARAATPDGGEMVLSQRDRELVIFVDGHWLMSSRTHVSEEAMAEAAQAALARPRASVLVGGLGFGFTLAAALARAAPSARLVVAELCAPVIDWVRGPAAGLAGRALDDPRVQVERADVLTLIRGARESFDAVLLDVDNGPWALTTGDNRGLYDERGVAALFRALRPGGTLVVWSAGPEPRFTARLARTGFRAEARPVAAHENGRGARHILFVAHRPRA